MSELRRLAASDVEDQTKVASLELIRRAGDTSPIAAEFSNPEQISRNAAKAFASQLDCAAEIARAAQCMMDQLAEPELLAMLELMMEELPSAALQLCEEFSSRLDLSLALRSDISRLVTVISLGHAPNQSPIQNLIKASDLLVATQDAHPPRCWRVKSSAASAQVAWHYFVQSAKQQRQVQFVVDSRGLLVSTVYQRSGHDNPSQHHGNDSGLSLVSDVDAVGYESLSFDKARELVAMAARTAVGMGVSLTPEYYLARDLLMLSRLHRSDLTQQSAHASVAGHAVDLLACGENLQAYDLLSRYLAQHPAAATQNAEFAIALGMSCFALEKYAQAQSFLGAACRLPTEPNRECEPDHLWNWACAAERNADVAAMNTALSRFIDSANHNSNIAMQHTQRVTLAKAMLRKSVVAKSSTSRNTRQSKARKPTMQAESPHGQPNAHV
jgi:hypothetical protein